MDNSVKRQKSLASLPWRASLMVLVAVFSVVLCGCGKESGSGKNDEVAKISMEGEKKDKKGTDIDDSDEVELTFKNEDDNKEFDPATCDYTLVGELIEAKGEKGGTVVDADQGAFFVGKYVSVKGSKLSAPLRDLLKSKISAKGGEAKIKVKVDPKFVGSGSQIADELMKMKFWLLDKKGEKISNCECEAEIKKK